jgi:hypothetical protein
LAIEDTAGVPCRGCQRHHAVNMRCPIVTLLVTAQWPISNALGVSVTKGVRASGLLSPRPSRGCISPSVPNPVSQPHSRQVVIRHGFQGLHSGDAATRCPIIDHDGERPPHERWHRGLSGVMVGSSHAALSARLCHTCCLDNPRISVQNFFPIPCDSGYLPRSRTWPHGPRRCL